MWVILVVVVIITCGDSADNIGREFLLAGKLLGWPLLLSFQVQIFKSRRVQSELSPCECRCFLGSRVV